MYCRKDIPARTYLMSPVSLSLEDGLKQTADGGVVVRNEDDLSLPCRLLICVRSQRNFTLSHAYTASGDFAPAKGRLESDSLPAHCSGKRTPKGAGRRERGGVRPMNVRLSFTEWAVLIRTRANGAYACGSVPPVLAAPHRGNLCRVGPRASSCSSRLPAQQPGQSRQRVNSEETAVVLR